LYRFQSQTGRGGQLTQITMDMFMQSKIAVSTYDPISGNATPGRQAISYRYKLFPVDVISETPQVEPCTYP
jgi:hypothetical protein